VKRAARWLLAAGLLWPLSDLGAPLAPAHQAEWLPGKDGSWRVLRAGQGDTTLLLLHGYGESLISYRAIVDQLAQRYRVVAVDLPGFGLSDKPPGPYDLPTMVERLRDFVQRWVPGPIVIVGHSMGGEIGAALALTEPDRVVALALIAPGGYRLGSWLKQPGGLPFGHDGWIGSGIAYVLPVHDPAWLREPPERIAYEPYLDPAYRRTAQALDEFDFGALQDRFRDLRQPVLLLWGDRDPTIPLSIGQAIADQLRHGRLVVIHGALHRPQQTHPDQVVAEIEGFLTTASGVP
jgi:pimeloyl-ACP methyl ester carboxylesterase